MRLRSQPCPENVPLSLPPFPTNCPSVDEELRYWPITTAMTSSSCQAISIEAKARSERILNHMFAIAPVDIFSCRRSIIVVTFHKS